MGDLSRRLRRAARRHGLREPWFGLLAIAGFLYSFGLLRWPWRLLGVGAVAVLAGIAQASGVPTNTAIGVTASVAIIVANVVVMCGYCWIQWTSDELGSERSRALDEVRQDERPARGESRRERRAAGTVRDPARVRSGVQDERARMAREIHDTLAQGLIGIITQLEAADLAQPTRCEWRRHFEAASALARESLGEARRSVLRAAARGARGRAARRRPRGGRAAVVRAAGHPGAGHDDRHGRTRRIRGRSGAAASRAGSARECRASTPAPTGSASRCPTLTAKSRWTFAMMDRASTPERDAGELERRRIRARGPPRSGSRDLPGQCTSNRSRDVAQPSRCEFRYARERTNERADQHPAGRRPPGGP